MYLCICINKILTRRRDKHEDPSAEPPQCFQHFARRSVEESNSSWESKRERERPLNCSDQISSFVLHNTVYTRDIVGWQLSVPQCNFQVQVKNLRTKIREESRIRVYETSIALRPARAKVHYSNFSTFTYYIYIYTHIFIVTSLSSFHYDFHAINHPLGHPD